MIQSESGVSPLQVTAPGQRGHAFPPEPAESHSRRSPRSFPAVCLACGRGPFYRWRMPWGSKTPTQSQVEGLASWVLLLHLFPLRGAPLRSLWAAPGARSSYPCEWTELQTIVAGAGGDSFASPKPSSQVTRSEALVAPWHQPPCTEQPIQNHAPLCVPGGVHGRPPWGPDSEQTVP